MDQQTIRQFVDGELPPEKAAEVERATLEDESLRRHVAVERALRHAVGAQFIAETPAAPADLRRAVEAAMAREAALRAVEETHDRAAAAAPQPVLRRLFAGPTRANVFAVAACLLIVFSAVIVGMFGDEWGLGLRRQARQHASSINVEAMAEAVQRARAEHGRCMGRDSAADMPFRSPESISAGLSPVLGSPPPIFDLSASGLELEGGERCALPPLPDSTVHLMYLAPPGMAGLSIFMQPDQGQFGEVENLLESGRVYTPADLGVCAGEATCVFSDGETLFVVRASNPGILESAMAQMARQLAMNLRVSPHP